MHYGWTCASGKAAIYDSMQFFHWAKSFLNAIIPIFVYDIPSLCPELSLRSSKPLLVIDLLYHELKSVKEAKASKFWNITIIWYKMLLEHINRCTESEIMDIKTWM